MFGCFNFVHIVLTIFFFRAKKRASVDLFLQKVNATLIIWLLTSYSIQLLIPNFILQDWGFCFPPCQTEGAVESLQVQTYYQNLNDAVTCPSEKHLCSGLNNLVMNVTKKGKTYTTQKPRLDDRFNVVDEKCSTAGAPLWKKFTFSSTNYHRAGGPVAVLTGILTK